MLLCVSTLCNKLQGMDRTNRGHLSTFIKIVVDKSVVPKIEVSKYGTIFAYNSFWTILSEILKHRNKQLAKAIASRKRRINVKYKVAQAL